MTQFNYDLIMQPRTVVHCDTKEKALELLAWADSKGLEWFTGKRYSVVDRWDAYTHNTCYCLFLGEYSDVSYYQGEGYTILKYEDVLLDKEVLNHNKVKNPNVSHYDIWLGFEAIDVMKAILTKDEYVGYLKGNILKYQLRLSKKGGLDTVASDKEKIDDYTRELNSILGANNDN